MIKISRTIASILLVATIVISATAISAAKTEVNKIEFNLENGWYQTFDPATGMYTEVPASAVFDGNLKDKDGKLYLSPLNGIIKIDGVDNNIQIKGVKESEPIVYFEYEYGTQGQYYVKYESWQAPMEINMGGHKCIGSLNWYRYHYEDWDEVYDYQGSYLYFNGIIDGKPVSGYVESMNLPVIS